MNIEEMDASSIDNSIASRKHKRDKKDEATFQERIKIIVVRIFVMLLSILAWYYEKYFVKEPAHNWEFERRISLIVYIEG